MNRLGGWPSGFLPTKLLKDDRGRGGGRQRGRAKAIRGILVTIPLAGLILAFVGCDRKRQETSPKDTAVAAVAATNEPTTSIPNEAKTQPLDGPADPGMTEQLRIFIQEHGRVPADFGEFSRARLDSIPRVPQGMKWAIDPATQEVKLVKQ